MAIPKEVKTKRTDLVREFMTNHPDMREKRGIAREVLVLHPDRFKDIDDARSVVRFVTGTKGAPDRHKTPRLQRFHVAQFNKWSQENLNIDERPWDEPFVIPDSIKTLNVIADLHSVHLDPKVMKKFMTSTKSKQAVLINGDLIDSESLSRHLKGHNVIEYERELEICHSILKMLKEEFDHVYMKEGNHDFWLERYLLTNAREVFRILGLSLKELLRCGELQVQHIHNLKYIKYGDLDIIHGHEFSSSFGMGKFPATGNVDKWQTFKKRYDVRILAAHCHKHDYHISKMAKDGKYGEGWVIPAMCRRGPSYNPYARGDQGWAVLTNDSGHVTVDVKVL